MSLGAWQPALGLLDQFLFIKISLSELSVYSLHHHKFVRTPAKEKIRSISIGDPSTLNVCRTSEVTIKTMISYFFQHCKQKTPLKHGVCGHLPFNEHSAPGLNNL
jgi:hypothetical protein